MSSDGKSRYHRHAKTSKSGSQNKIRRTKSRKRKAKGSAKKNKFMKFEPNKTTRVTFDPLRTKTDYKTYGKETRDEFGSIRTNAKGDFLNEDGTVIMDTDNRPFRPKLKYCYYGWQWEDMNKPPEQLEETIQEWAVGYEHNETLEEWIEQGYFTFDVTRIGNGLLDTRYKIKVVLKIQAVPV